MSKKIIYFVFAVIMFSCSTDDDSVDKDGSCKDQVWGLSNANGDYSVEFGPTEFNTTTMEINKSTFDYYWEIVGDDIENDCWEGMK
jgi:hypothetical protein